MGTIMDDPVVLMDGSGATMGATTQPDIPTVKVDIQR